MGIPTFPALRYILYIRDNPGCSCGQIAEALGVSWVAVSNAMFALQYCLFIERSKYDKRVKLHWLRPIEKWKLRKR